MREEPARTGVDLDREVPLADGSRTTVRSLHDRVAMLEPGIFRFYEVKKPTPETLQTMTAKIEELASDLDAYGVIIDLSDSEGSTSSDYRRYIPRHFEEMASRSGGALRQIAVALDTNPVVRVAAKFIIGRVASAPFEVYRTPDEAIAGVRRALQR